MSKLFANGTEGEAWAHVWCHACAHDHAYHPGGDDGKATDGCSIILEMLQSDDVPDAITPEPADVLGFHMPPLHLCASFIPCEPCGGDPNPEIRANVVRVVTEAIEGRTT